MKIIGVLIGAVIIAAIGLLAVKNIVVAPKPEDKAALPKRIEFVFGGDIMLGRNRL